MGDQNMTAPQAPSIWQALVPGYGDFLAARYRRDERDWEFRQRQQAQEFAHAQSFLTHLDTQYQDVFQNFTTWQSKETEKSAAARQAALGVMLAPNSIVAQLEKKRADDELGVTHSAVLRFQNDLDALTQARQALGAQAPPMEGGSGQQQTPQEDVSGMVSTNAGPNESGQAGVAPPPEELWRQLGIAEGLPLQDVQFKNGSFTIDAPDPERFQQYTQAIESLGKRTGAAKPPFFVNDLSPEAAAAEKAKGVDVAQGREVLQKEYERFNQLEDKATMYEARIPLLKRASLPSASDAMVSAAMASALEANPDDKMLQRMTSAAAEASPEQRKAIVKEMVADMESVVKATRTAQGRHRKGYQAYRKLSPDVGDEEAGAGGATLAPQAGESRVQFGERYATAKGWDFSKPLKPEQLDEIRAAYSGGQ